MFSWPVHNSSHYNAELWSSKSPPNHLADRHVVSGESQCVTWPCVDSLHCMVWSALSTSVHPTKTAPGERADLYQQSATQGTPLACIPTLQHQQQAPAAWTLGGGGTGTIPACCAQSPSVVQLLRNTSQHNSHIPPRCT